MATLRQSEYPAADDSDGNNPFWPSHPISIHSLSLRRTLEQQCCGDDGITACRPSACKLSAGFTPVFSVDVQKKEISGQSRNNKITEL